MYIDDFDIIIMVLLFLRTMLYEGVIVTALSVRPSVTSYSTLYTSHTFTDLNQTLYIASRSNGLFNFQVYRARVKGKIGWRVLIKYCLLSTTL